MSNTTKYATFDPGTPRSQRTKQRLEQIEPFRKGYKQVIFPARAFDVQAMKSCPICNEASAITTTAQFCCRHCLVLFQ